MGRAETTIGYVQGVTGEPAIIRKNEQALMSDCVEADSFRVWSRRFGTRLRPDYMNRKMAAVIRVIADAIIRPVNFTWAAMS